MNSNLPSDPADVFKYFNYPFSGAVDVSQRFIQQMGFININNLKTGDEQKGPEIEKKIIDDVASYGRQLGWIIEVLNIIVNRYELKDLTDEEYSSMDQFFDLIKNLRFRVLRATDFKIFEKTHAALINIKNFE